VSERRARRARRPDAARSQHFLRSQALAAEIVRDAGVRPDELVLDLGAGSGRLTAELARAAQRVVAVELDPRLSARLRGRWPNVHVVCGDAASVPLPHDPFRVVANLPFSRTNAIFRHLLDDAEVPLVRADLVVEWGVAVKRALPWPSSVNGVLWGARFSASVARRLPRNAFVPPPRADAAVLVFERRELPLVASGEFARYARFVAKGFRHGLRAVATTRTLRTMQLAGVEARHLDAHEWATLFAVAG
jgi:23S rRNA (adenine-N6)-dimethyltransferase